MSNDRRVVPLTYFDKNGQKREVGRVLTTNQHNPLEILVDDPEIAKMLSGELLEGSFSIQVKE